MRIAKISFTAAAIATLAVTPVVAQVVSAQTTSARASVSEDGENNLSGTGTAALIIAFTAAAVAAAFIVSDEDAPTSP